MLHQRTWSFALDEDVVADRGVAPRESDRSTRRRSRIAAAFGVRLAVQCSKCARNEGEQFTAGCQWTIIDALRQPGARMLLAGYEGTVTPLQNCERGLNARPILNRCDVFSSFATRSLIRATCIAGPTMPIDR
jgi:hypothetical protein